MACKLRIKQWQKKYYKYKDKFNIGSSCAIKERQTTKEQIAENLNQQDNQDNEQKDLEIPLFDKINKSLKNSIHLNSIHFVMHSKGGVGKSVVSFLMAQYILNKVDNSKVAIIDIEPNYRTLSRYKSLNVENIDVLNDKSAVIKILLA
ncbi:TraL-like protein [Moraxella macacae 0408225]|uniref:TraL-like protein n=1 Tax=Moraxella macacae 0408225 TaxID=1230338 RepID=L2F5M5_9GAMM|nr:TraL-like protein [Moraxella macacae]ELA08195.1 TraL-like protein [Moraxella macacae 0408225]